jgi:hypothetical protein
MISFLRPYKKAYTPAGSIPHLFLQYSRTLIKPNSLSTNSFDTVFTEPDLQGILPPKIQLLQNLSAP